MYDLKEEKWLFYNDFKEYRNSIEGQKLDIAFKNNNSNITELINDYYTKRNSDTLTYESEQDKIRGYEQDLELAKNLKEN